MGVINGTSRMNGHLAFGKIGQVEPQATIIERIEEKLCALEDAVKTAAFFMRHKKNVDENGVVTLKILVDDKNCLPLTKKFNNEDVKADCQIEIPVYGGTATLRYTQDNKMVSQSANSDGIISGLDKWYKIYFEESAPPVSKPRSESVMWR